MESDLQEHPQFSPVLRLAQHPQAKAHRPPASLGTKRKVFAFVTLALPFLFLVVLEIILRLISYGPNLSLLTMETIGEKRYFIMNQGVKSRYFAHVDFTPSTSLDYFQIPKPEGVFRIVCLGGSTTAGFPFGFAGSFSTFLRERLVALFPEQNIEVVNFGMTATNSFTALDIARELEVYDPDLLIVYDGHNEFYGALGIASHESTGSSRALSLLYLRLIHFRTFLALRDLFFTISNAVGSAGQVEEGTMMRRLAAGQYVGFHDDRYEKAHAMFKGNLRDIADLCITHGVPVIFGTQVSNLRDLPPFVSDAQVHIPPEERSLYDEHMKRGRLYLDDGQTDSALVSFHEALRVDSLDAGCHYRIAQCLEATGEKRGALHEYVLARDYDMLRFRTSSDFNSAIMEIGDGSHVFALNLEEVFKSESPDSLIGNNLILEHLHPTLRGNFLMARAYCSAMRGGGILAPERVWAERDTVSEDRLWDSRPVTIVDERAAALRLEKLLSDWPFTSRALRRINSSNDLDRTIQRLANGETTWEQAHVAAAEYYVSSGDLQSAEREYRAIIRVLRVNVSPYLRLSQLYLSDGRTQEAADVLLKSLSFEKTAFAYRALGAIAIESGQGDEAVVYLEKAMALAPTADLRTETGYLLALAHSRAQRREEAVRQLRQVLQREPDYQPAKELLRRLEGSSR